MDLGFLKTKQKNTNIKFSNFDFNHSNDYTSQLGQILVTQCTKVLPNDKIKHRINEETLLQPLENPSFTKFKHVHKSFYYPNTVLWKYWDNFLTNKPDDLWTNSDITSYINERQPYSIPKCYFKDLLPYMAIAGGFFQNMEIGFYLPQLPYIIKKLVVDGGATLNSNDIIIMRAIQPPYIPYQYDETLAYDDNSYSSCANDHNAATERFFSPLFYDINGDSSEFAEVGFYSSNGTFIEPFQRSWNPAPIGLNCSTIISWLTNRINLSSLTSDVKNQLLSYCTYNNFRWFVRFQIISEPVNKVNFTHLYSNKTTPDDQPFDKTDYKNLICVSSQNNTMSAPITGDNRFFRIENTYDRANHHYFVLPLPSAIESTSFGFTPLAFFFYNCRNISKHLDMMGITIPSDFINFTQQDLYEPINMLPFFAYNRFYHEEIADKQRQVNCPQWHNANGLLCTYNNYFSLTDDASLEKYQKIGWTLHFDDIPYNKQFNLQDSKITIYTPFAAAMLLMGFDINLLVTNQSYSDVFQLSEAYSNSPCVTSFLQPYFQSYNGLLHLQYANFAPDYFNSSVMDPLAGAQDIQIPSTITQLQEKSKLQELLNQTAWTRNIKEFLQSQFDAFSKYSTIDDPVITGSCDVDVNISQVLQTSESTPSSELGKRAGIGSAYGNGWLCDNEFHEFGYYMTVSYFVMNSTYINRLDKSLIAESSYLELPFPQLANLGNEAIKYHEVKFGQSENYKSLALSPLRVAPYIHGFAQVFKGDETDLTDEPETPLRIPKVNGSLENSPIPLVENAIYDGSNINFGYIPRFSSYKFKFDQVHGEFLTTLKNWVNTRELQILPLQTYTFVSYECQAQLSNLMKNFVDKDQLIADSFLTNSVNVMSVRRCLPFVVNPTL